jgi:hypothetical protein
VSAFKRATRRFAGTIALGIAALALSAPVAQAGPLADSASPCADQTYSQPFLPWADPASYTLAPDGSFENGAGSWSLSGGAAVDSGNESYHVGGAADSHSLSLPSGSSATSGAMCVGIEHPDIRVFARNSGSPASTLRVDVLFEDASGNVNSLPIGTVSSGSSWQPTAPSPVVANLLAVFSNDQTAVAFRFTPQGYGGSWRIDDVYVDPWHH